MSELIGMLLEAVRGGTVPRPAPGEPIDDFRFRCAHAGAVLAMVWIAEHGSGGATVLPLPVPSPADDVDPDDDEVRGA